MWNAESRERCRLKGAGYLYAKEYSAWKDMRARCLHVNHPRYKDYGLRGIKICDEWNNFYTFLKDMGRAAKGLSLDRIDNNGNYTKKNCRWADQKTQNRNTRQNKKVFAFGKSLTVIEWSEEINIPAWTLRDRIYGGKMSAEELLTRPVRKKTVKKDRQFGSSKRNC